MSPPTEIPLSERKPVSNRKPLCLDVHPACIGVDGRRILALRFVVLGRCRFFRRYRFLPQFFGSFLALFKPVGFACRYFTTFFRVGGLATEVGGNAALAGRCMLGKKHRSVDRKRGLTFPIRRNFEIIFFSHDCIS